MYKRLSKISLFFLFLLPFVVNSQEVQISKEFSIRNDFSYDILGKINEHVLLLRDRGLSHELEVFDDNLKHLDTKELRFKKRKINIIGTVPRDTFFTCYYSFKSKGEFWIRARNFDHWGIEKDTAVITVMSDNKPFKRPTFQYSENRKKSVIFSMGFDNTLNVMVIDNDSLTTIWDDEIIFDQYNLREDFQKLILTDDGDIFILLDKDNNRGRKERHHLLISYLPNGSQDIIQHKIGMAENLTTAVDMVYDNHNKQLNIAGLYNEKNTQDAVGYFYSMLPLTQIIENAEARFVPFKREFIAEVYGQKVTKERSLKHFTLSGIQTRADGGIILQSEMQKSYSRRSGYNRALYNSDLYAPRGWTDYYNEDMVFINLNPDGTELWKEIFHKKQFSQDDDGIFSSFFTLRTPSRMRIIYNDEIKKDNTVSEYVISPIGASKRKAVLSTEGQGLKLRFQDAVQISPTTIIVPSERSYGLNLVKVAY